MPIKLIVLVGKGEKGKTSTLKHVIRKLIDLGAIKATASLNNFKGMRVNDTLAVLLERGDVSMELMYKNKRIGITTFGDDRKSIEDKIDLFISDNCDCIICASHPDGSSYTYIQELIATQNFNHHSPIWC